MFRIVIQTSKSCEDNNRGVSSIVTITRVSQQLTEVLWTPPNAGTMFQQSFLIDNHNKRLSLYIILSFIG